MLVTNEAVLAKGSEKWRGQLLDMEQRFEETFRNAADVAFENGELVGTDKTATIERLNYGLWALAAGFSQIQMQKSSFSPYADVYRLPSPFSSDSPQFQCIVDFINTFEWSHPLDEMAIQEVCAYIEEYRPEFG